MAELSAHLLPFYYRRVFPRGLWNASLYIPLSRAVSVPPVSTKAERTFSQMGETVIPFMKNVDEYFCIGKQQCLPQLTESTCNNRVDYLT